ncbi:lysophospholipid acyltransferase family protein [Aureimonas leprariae]|uniref:lysophospholipid acyltransferase family protein n=1 Tax=Plantimonas leprariae TaxID=2615207 RepID=UPI001FE3259E|nr:lysophospholipid acyltransferase family protein [Aureimonas leprariae]
MTEADASAAATAATAAGPEDRPERAARRKPSRLHTRFRQGRRRLFRSRFALSTAARLAYGWLRFVGWTQRRVPECSAAERRMRENHPSIVAFWHGQHLLAPFFRPADLRFVALLSKNVDAEVNAWVVRKFGIDTVRGSGGREQGRVLEKGGARALIALRRRVAEGSNAFMIADISKATAREAGLGVVTLARITGRPIIPSAAVTSRRLVLARTWDRTTIPLPFGRMAIVMGEPIFVPADADEAVMEAKRQEVTRAIEAANRQVAALADGKRAR